jgi:hypothetical protein
MPTGWFARHPARYRTQEPRALECLRSVMRTYRIVRAERPDIVRCIALRPIVLGGLAGAGALVLAPTGLGQLWIE